MLCDWVSKRFVVRLSGVSVFGAVCLAMAGCGAGVGDLTGKVTSGDKAVCSGTVIVASAGGTSHTGPIQDDGTYTVQGVPGGTAKVGVTSPNPKTMVVARRKEKDAPKSEVTLPDAAKWFAIPDKYADPNTSGLTTTIKSGKNDFNIELK